MIRLRFLAHYAELVGREEMELDIAQPATVGDLVRRVKDQLPSASQLPDHPLAAVNLRHVRLDAAVRDGDEVALLPPLAGG